MKFETIGQYHDAWSSIVLFAPDGFTDLDGVRMDDQPAALDEAFREIFEDFGFVEKKIKDPRLLAILRELIVMSLEAFHAGDAKRGAHVLQECEGFIWPSRGQHLKYVVEAEMRVFGRVESFKNVVVSPYPYEGAHADLGSAQKILLEYAKAQAQRYIDAQQSFQSLAWAMEAGGSVVEVKKRSRKAVRAFLREEASYGRVVGSAVASFPFGGYKGLLAVNLEEVDRPRVEAIALVEEWQVGPLRYHFHEAEIFDPSPRAA
jgi:hypothetical protein